MKFYIATNSHERLRRNWFGRSIYELQLISIYILSERGEAFYAISDDVNIRTMSRPDALKRYDEIVAEGNEWNTMKIPAMGSRLRNFVYEETMHGNRDSSVIEFIGLNCAKDFLLLASIFGGIEHPDYPMYFPNTATELIQSISEHVSHMADEEFALSTTYSLYIPKTANTMYTHSEKMEMFATHFLYPQFVQTENYPATLSRRTGYIKRLAEFLTKVKCYSSEELQGMETKNIVTNA